MITLVSLTTIISGSIFLTSGFYIFLSWRKKREDFLLRIFFIFLLSIGFQMLFLTLGLAVFYNNYLMSNISWLIAHIFLIFGMSNLFLLPIRIKIPAKEKLVRKITIACALIGILILLLNLSKVELFRSPENIINWHVPGLSIAVIAGFSGVISLFSAYVFIRESFKVKSGLMKFRSIFLGSGILVFFIGGPMHNFVSNWKMAALAASLSVLGGFLIVAGIYLSKIKKIVEKEPQQI